MRRLAALAALAACLAGCTTARSDGAPRIQTTSEAKRENLKGAVSAPLRDLNVLRTLIPEVLLAAMADPYERPPKPARPGKAAACADLVKMVESLDSALGPDLDSPPDSHDGLLVKGHDAALGVVAGAASDTIPFRGWVRKLSGAEGHDRLVQAAIGAGSVRRAYLKGLGEARGCDPPATPSHQLDGSPVATQEVKPRYSIR